MGIDRERERELGSYRELARSFAARELAKKTRERDRHPFGPFFHDVLEKAREAGFLGILVPPDQGGAGGDMEILCTVLEEISRVDASLAAVILTNTAAQLAVLSSGSKGACSELLGGTGSTRQPVLAYPCYLDPSAGAEGLPMAVPRGDGAAMSGDIPLLSLGGQALRAVVPALARDDGGFSFFLLDLEGQGVARSAPVLTLGLHACPCVDVSLDSAACERLGGPGSGPGIFTGMYAPLLAASAFIQAGIMRGSYECALAYARERRQGGRKIINWSEVEMILADMLMRVSSAGLMLRQALMRLDGDDASSLVHAEAAALLVHSMAGTVTSDGVQVLGGYGYMKDYGQEKRYRDAHQLQAFLGQPAMKKLSMIRRSQGAGI